MSTNLTTIDFHGAKLVAVAGDRPESTLVAMKPIVEAMGLDWSSQLKKIKSHAVLSKGMVEITIPSSGGPQVTQALALNRIHGWLMTIHPGKIADVAARSKIIEIQSEAADVIFDHFFGKAIASGPHLTAQQTGGIAKAVVGKALAPIESKLTDLTRKLETTLAAYDPSASFTTEYRPMLWIVTQRDVPQKGRGGLVRNMSRRCSAWLTHSRLEDKMRPSRDVDRRLFHIDALAAWMKIEGNGMIRAHMDRLVGQSAMKLEAKQTKRPFAKTPERAL